MTQSLFDVPLENMRMLGKRPAALPHVAYPKAV